MFEEFSDQARIWIYGFKNQLSVEDIKIVQNKLDNFVANWKSHKDTVKGSFDKSLRDFISFGFAPA